MCGKKITPVNVFLTIIIFVSTFIIGFQIMTIKRLQNNGIAFGPGETLPELELLNLDNSPMQCGEIAGGVTVLYVFKTPCSACNTNLSPWNNISKFFGNRIHVMGIIPDGNQTASKLVDEKKVNFSLYVPVDKHVLRKKMRLKLNMAQTIVLYKNQVIAIRLGNLSPEDLQTIIAAIENLLNNRRPL